MKLKKCSNQRRQRQFEKESSKIFQNMHDPHDYGQSFERGDQVFLVEFRTVFLKLLRKHQSKHRMMNGMSTIKLIPIQKFQIKLVHEVMLPVFWMFFLFIFLKIVMYMTFCKVKTNHHKKKRMCTKKVTKIFQNSKT